MLLYRWRQHSTGFDVGAWPVSVARLSAELWRFTSIYTSFEGGASYGRRWCRPMYIQMQVVFQLEIQLQKEKDRLQVILNKTL